LPIYKSIKDKASPRAIRFLSCPWYPVPTSHKWPILHTYLIITLVHTNWGNPVSSIPFSYPTKIINPSLPSSTQTGAIWTNFPYKVISMLETVVLSVKSKVWSAETGAILIRGVHFPYTWQMPQVLTYPLTIGLRVQVYIKDVLVNRKLVIILVGKCFNFMRFLRKVSIQWIRPYKEHVILHWKPFGVKEKIIFVYIFEKNIKENHFVHTFEKNQTKSFVHIFTLKFVHILQIF